MYIEKHVHYVVHLEPEEEAIAGSVDHPDHHRLAEALSKKLDELGLDGHPMPIIGSEELVLDMDGGGFIFANGYGYEMERALEGADVERVATVKLSR